MNYCGITAPDIANGTGCRVVLWISGCNHKCNGCHNPETWDYKYGKKFDEDAKNIIYKWLSKPYIKGLTISGGDPLDRSNDELLEILDLCIYVKTNFPDKDIWIYSGFTYEQLLEKSNTNILNILFICKNNQFNIIVTIKRQTALYFHIEIDLSCLTASFYQILI